MAMASENRLNGGADIRSVLTTSGLLSGAALERARRLESESGERIDLIASKLGLISDRDLAQAYATLIGSPVVVPEEFPSGPVAADRLRAAFLKRARLIPVVETEDGITVAMADPLDDAAAQAVQRRRRQSVRFRRMHRS